MWYEDKNEERPPARTIVRSARGLHQRPPSAPCSSAPYFRQLLSHALGIVGITSTSHSTWIKRIWAYRATWKAA